MAYANLRDELRDRVAYLSLDRPEKPNALTLGLMDDLLHALAEANAGLGCIAIRGRGPACCSPAARSTTAPPNGSAW